MLVVDLGKWMNKTLINWGIDPAVADRFDETIMALLMIVVAIVLNYLCPGDSNRRNETVYEAEAPSVEYIADEAQGVSSFDSYHPGFFGLCFVADGFYPGKRVVVDFSKGMCHLYYFLFTIGYQWDSVDDNGYL